MLIQVLKQIRWLGLLYFIANNIFYQLLFKKYINEPQLQRQRRNRQANNSQEAPQNQPEVVEKNWKQILLFVLLIGSWFMHNALSLYLLDVEGCGKAIYEKFLKGHVEYIKANNHPIQTEFIKTLLCEQSQIVVALILVICLFQKNYLWKALAFLVAYHFAFTYHQVKNAIVIEKPSINIKTIEESHNASIIYNNHEYETTQEILENSSDEIEEVLSPEIQESSGFYEPADENKEDSENEDCFKRLSWFAYIPLKAISLGFEIAFDAGEVFEVIVCKGIA